MANSINIPLQSFSLYRKARVSALVSADTSIRVFFLLILQTLLLSIRRGFQGYGNNLILWVSSGTPGVSNARYSTPYLLNFGIGDRMGCASGAARVWLFREVKNKHREEETRSIPHPFLSIRPLRSLSFPPFFTPRTLRSISLRYDPRVRSLEAHPLIRSGEALPRYHGGRVAEIKNVGG